MPRITSGAGLRPSGDRVWTHISKKLRDLRLRAYRLGTPRRRRLYQMVQRGVKCAAGRTAWDFEDSLATGFAPAALGSYGRKPLTSTIQMSVVSSTSSSQFERVTTRDCPEGVQEGCATARLQMRVPGRPGNGTVVFAIVSTLIIRSTLSPFVSSM